MRSLVHRLATQTTATETTAASSFDRPDVLAGAIAVTSFPAYDALGAVADDPDRAALLLTHLIRSLAGYQGRCSSSLFLEGDRCRSRARDRCSRIAASAASGSRALMAAAICWCSTPVVPVCAYGK